jgi:hypothetical protein
MDFSDSLYVFLSVQVHDPCLCLPLQDACQPGPPFLGRFGAACVRDVNLLIMFLLLGIHSRIVNLVAGAIMVLGGISQFFSVTM